MKRTLLAATLALTLAACSLSKVDGKSFAANPLKRGAASSAVDSSASAAKSSASEATSSASPTSAEPPKAAPSEAPTNLPERLVAAITKERFSDNPKAAAAYQKLFSISLDAFEAKWTAYQQRKAEVDAGLAESERLSQAGKFHEAATLLKGLITPPPLNAKQELEMARQMIEPRDAEFPALLALAKIAVRAEMPQAFGEIANGLVVRREVGEKEEERWLWIAYRNPRDFKNISHAQKPETVTLFREKALNAENATFQGARLASGLFENMEPLGVKRVDLRDHAAAATGEWVYAGASDVKFNGKVGKASHRKEERIPYDCVPTDRISGIDWSTGKFTYFMNCQYKKKVTSFQLEVQLADHTGGEGMKTVMFVGKVKKKGPAWKVAQAAAVQLYRVSSGEWSPEERETVNGLEIVSTRAKP
jgi:hypothetical protein